MHLFPRTGVGAVPLMRYHEQGSSSGLRRFPSVGGSSGRARLLSEEQREELIDAVSGPRIVERALRDEQPVLPSDAISAVRGSLRSSDVRSNGLSRSKTAPFASAASALATSASVPSGSVGPASSKLSPSSGALVSYVQSRFRQFETQRPIRARGRGKPLF